MDLRVFNEINLDLESAVDVDVRFKDPAQDFMKCLLACVLKSFT